MIPKVIHYCWFGRSPLPELATKCIASWRKFFPDYEIREWNEDNFDVNILPYTSEAYQAKKYAFVSDYARFWILYHYGGLYFDTDVEVIKGMDDVIARGNFMGYEEISEKAAHPNPIAPGLGLGFAPGLGVIREILDQYMDIRFIKNGKANETTVVKYATDIVQRHKINKYKDGIDVIDDGIYLYSPEYFCPLNYYTGKLTITDNTRTIHHYTASWMTAKQKRNKKIADILGSRLASIIINLRKILHIQ